MYSRGKPTQNTAFLKLWCVDEFADPMIPGVMMAFMGIFYAGMGAGALFRSQGKPSMSCTGENVGEIWGKTSGKTQKLRWLVTNSSLVCWFVVSLRF